MLLLFWNGASGTPGAQNLTLTCDAGSYGLTGSAVTFEVRRNYTLVCNAGSYLLTGTDVSFGNVKSYTLACDAGSYGLTGTACVMVRLTPTATPSCRIFVIVADNRTRVIEHENRTLEVE